MVELVRSSCEGTKQHLSRIGILGAPSKQLRSKETTLELLRSSREAKLRNLSRREFWQVHFRLWWSSFEAAEKQRSNTLGEEGFWASPLRIRARVNSGNSPLRLWWSSFEAAEHHRSSTLVECEFLEFTLRSWWSSFEAVAKERSSILVDLGFWEFTLRLRWSSFEAAERQRCTTLVDGGILGTPPFDCGEAPAKRPRSKGAAP